MTAVGRKRKHLSNKIGVARFSISSIRAIFPSVIAVSFGQSCFGVATANLAGFERDDPSGGCYTTGGGVTLKVRLRILARLASRPFLPQGGRGSVWRQCLVSSVRPLPAQVSGPAEKPSPIGLITPESFVESAESAVTNGAPWSAGGEK